MSYIGWLRSKVGHERIFLNVACGLIVNERGELLLQKRGDEKKSEVWGFPGGVIELGETAPDCLVREIKEETGLAVVIDRFQGVYMKDHNIMYPNGDECQLVSFVFVCKEISGELTSDGIETIDLKYFDVPHMPKLFGNSTINYRILEDYSRKVSGTIY